MATSYLKNILLPVLTLWLAIFASATVTRAQSTVRCTFELTSPGLEPGQPVYITGNVELLGYWDPGVVMMKKSGDRSHTRTLLLPGPTELEYKYTLGSWEKEGAGPTGNALPNFKVRVTADTVVRDTVAHWTDRPPVAARRHTTVGSPDIWEDMKGLGLRDRTVVVWLPPAYYKEPDRRYPVIYLHDGQNVFDAATSAFGIEWRVDEAIDSLVKTGTIPPLIAVGIYNTPDRSAEYLPGDTASAYMNFIVDQLKPFIDSTYRTLPNAENTITCGASAGGTIAFMLAWEFPATFSKAICMSPALKINQHDYVKTVAETKEFREDIFLYMDIGGVAIERKLKPGILEMIGRLSQKGYHEGSNFIFVEDSSASHDEAAWAKRFPFALQECLTSDRVVSSEVFVSGEEGYSHFRIPALAFNKEMVFAFAEGRHYSSADHGEISIVLKRSVDRGSTWQALIPVVVAAGGSAQNPTPVWVEETGTLLLLYTRRTVGSDTEHMIRSGTSQGYMGVYITQSSDLGKTWTAEKEITGLVKKQDWRWYALGPGGAIIMLYNPEHAGRIIVPANHSLSGGSGNEFLGAHVIYSDDQGETWTIGATDSRGEGSVNPNETAVVELSNGTLYFNTRNHSGDDTIAHRAFTLSHDGGRSFIHPFRHEPGLLTPIVHASMARNEKTIFFIAPNDWNDRVNLTLWQRDDGTVTWTKTRRLYTGPAAYSSSGVRGGNQLMILYEADDYHRILFRAMPCPTGTLPDRN